jgi:aminomethyltransferase
MPVQYTGVIDEHMAVRTRAGLFDVSHMGEVEVKGPESLAYLQHVTCNDVSRLAPGRIQYSAITTPEGTFVDDLLVMKMAELEYLLVINAGNTPKDVDWLHYHAKGYDVRVENVSRAWCQLALQGPKAQEILQPLTSACFPRSSTTASSAPDVAGVSCIVSRTGYTGEDGFELYGPADAAETLWHAVLAAGAPHGLVPAGLAARDTLRPRSEDGALRERHRRHHDRARGRSRVDREAREGRFPGTRRARPAKGRRHRAQARRIRNRRASDRAHGHRALVDGTPVGDVTSGTFAPFLKKNIGLATCRRRSPILVRDSRWRSAAAASRPSWFRHRSTNDRVEH